MPWKSHRMTIFPPGGSAMARRYPLNGVAAYVIPVFKY